MKMICFLLALLPISFAAAQTSKLVGDISILSNSIDRGITQSNKGPAVDTGFGYQFGSQGKIAMAAGSVNYPGESANVRLGFYGEYKFIFSPNADLKVRNDWVRYFSEGQRNKTIIALDQNISTWHILMSREDNFEGTTTARNWFGLNKDWPWKSFILNTAVGYSQVASPLENFFDTRAAITYPTGSVAFTVGTTYVSNSGQFNGRADTAFFLIIAVNF